jgi:hypothetical protein
MGKFKDIATEVLDRYTDGFHPAIIAADLGLEYDEVMTIVNEDFDTGFDQDYADAVNKEYRFTDADLEHIRTHIELDRGFVEDAFRWYWREQPDATVLTEDVEDFAIAFYTQYNRRFGTTY